jgi:hypothetical protein
MGAGQSSNACPRCGEPVPLRGTGRPATWCSQACRRASYEERRAANHGAIAVQIVERVKVTEHDLSECVARVAGSPTASRRVLQAMTVLLRQGVLTGHPKWSPTHTAAVRLSQSLARIHRT